MAALTRLRILLLQARYPDDPAKTEELHSFAARAGVAREQITSHDMLQGPPSWATVRRHDALMVGGSGEFYVSKQDLPRHDEHLNFLGEVAAAGFPTFASCFGFQFLVQALGGTIIYDAENAELGTFELTLTEEGHSDPLFQQLPATFLAQMGHKDRADALRGVATLASSRRVPCEAIRVPGQPVWASQFHPELDRATNLGRFERYLDGYAAVMSPAEIDAAVHRFHESPVTMDLLRRFLKLVFE